MKAAHRILQENGVIMPDPAAVYIDPAVNLARIHPETVIYPGSRILGDATSIGPGCKIGEEGPTTLRDCQLAARVTVRSGFAHGSVLLEGADCGYASHIRQGSLLEEFVGVAHSNGLKQTILMPFTKVGSLTNFCDVMMAGGTGTSNHSEVGSSYVHFNYTPHQDKATPTILGDAPRGVLLDQNPIFLGGQGGIVGPCRVAFGSVIAAGIVVRRDILQPNLLLLAAGGSQRVLLRPFLSSLYGSADRILANNLYYLGNLLALRAWYAYGRAEFMRRTPWDAACLEGAIKMLDHSFRKRLDKLGQLAPKFAASAQRAALEGQNTSLPPFSIQERFAAGWATLQKELQACAARPHSPDSNAATVLSFLSAPTNKPYIEAVQALEPRKRSVLTAWMDRIVESVTGLFIV